MVIVVIVVDGSESGVVVALIFVEVVVVLLVFVVLVEEVIVVLVEEVIVDVCFVVVGIFGLNLSQLQYFLGGPSSILQSHSALKSALR